MPSLSNSGYHLHAPILIIYLFSFEIKVYLELSNITKFTNIITISVTVEEIINLI